MAGAKPFLCVAVFLVGLHLCLAAEGPASRNIDRRTVVEPFRITPYWQQQWRWARDAEGSENLHFYLMLRTNKEHLITEKALRVSDPDSPDYGKYLTREQLYELAAAPQEVQDSVMNWVREASIASGEPLALFSYGDAIKVTTSVRNTQQLLASQFQVFRHVSGHELVRTVQGATLPTDVAENVKAILGVSDFTLPLKYSPIEHKQHLASRETRDVAPEPFVDPALLKNEYNVPQTLAASQLSNRQGVVAFYDYYSLEALRLFESTFSLPTASVLNTGPQTDCTPFCDQVESDLDVQYITAMGTGVHTIFRAYAGSAFTAEFAMDISNTVLIPQSEVAYIYSISYGSSELGNEAYIVQSEIQLAKLAALGITVFVASGDDGAPGWAGLAYNCPLDKQHYCPFGGCTESHTLCGEFVLSYPPDNLTCIFPTGFDSNRFRSTAACWELIVVRRALNDGQYWAAATPGCTLGVDTDIFGNPWFFSDCSCVTLATGFTSPSGYVWSAYTFDPANGPALNPLYPASSLWVTSVGATQFTGASSPYTEIGASTLNNPLAIFATGGGFSNLQTRPSYQNAAVNGYLNSPSVTLPPAALFNKTGRGYPDIAFSGHNYLIAGNFKTGNQTCNPYCNFTSVDGTSASSPSVAGLFALINDAIISIGRPPLGFLNPLLYKMAQDFPATFHDITVGDIRATETSVCLYGYEAAPGWDPVSGLGSPDFQNIYAYIVSGTNSAGSQLSGVLAELLKYVWGSA